MKPAKRANVKSYAFFKKLFGGSWADLSKRHTEIEIRPIEHVASKLFGNGR